MAALTKDRNTRTRGEKARKVVVPLAAATKIFCGAGVCINAAGFAVPASDTAALITWGRAEAQVDNTLGAAGDLYLEVCKAVCAWNASGLTQANIGDQVVWVDDNTVGLAAATTNDIVAGVLEEIDPVSGEAWVAMLP
jgi:hypothetical protein